MTDYWNWPANKGLRSTSQGGDDSLFAGIGSMGSEYLIRESVQNALDAIDFKLNNFYKIIRIKSKPFSTNSIICSFPNTYDHTDISFRW